MRGRKERRPAAIVRELEIPSPFSLPEFVAGLEQQRHRPIQLCPFSSGPGIPCGMWIGTDQADYVFHEQGTTPFHQTHIALHELAHMLLGHRGGTQVWEGLASLLAPEVDPQFVQLILGRSVYTSAEEQDAETLASLIHSQCGDAPEPVPVTGPKTGHFVRLLERAWGGGTS